MPDFADPDAELAAIRAEFAIMIVYTPLGGTAGDPIQAVEADDPGSDFMGPGDALRRITFEIGVADLVTEPNKGDRIDHPDGTCWRVTESYFRRDIAAFIVTVEALP